MKCQYNFCKREATHQVSLLIASNAEQIADKSTPILCLCNKHKKNVPDFKQQAMAIGSTGRTNWDELCDAYVAMGKDKPVMEHCNVIIEPILEPVYKLPPHHAN